MTKTQRFCDVCGKEIKGTWDPWAWVALKHANIAGRVEFVENERGSKRPADLCFKHKREAIDQLYRALMDAMRRR